MFADQLHYHLSSDWGISSFTDVYVQFVFNFSILLVKVGVLCPIQQSHIGTVPKKLRKE